MKKILCLFLACLFLLCSCGNAEQEQPQTPSSTDATQSSTTVAGSGNQTGIVDGTTTHSGTTGGSSGQNGFTGTIGGTTVATDNPTQSEKPACSHKDANGDTVCDICRISVIVSFDFYTINDLHGKLADADSHIGVDELTTYLKNARKTDDNAIFISAGDMWQGQSESNMTKGLIMTDWMNELDFAAMALGNHEYDWGMVFICHIRVFFFFT